MTTSILTDAANATPTAVEEAPVSQLVARAVIVLGLAGFAAIAGVYLLFRVQSPEAAGWGRQQLDSVWAGLGLYALLVATVASSQARRAAAARQTAGVVALLGLALMAGVLFMGVRVIEHIRLRQRFDAAVWKEAHAQDDQAQSFAAGASAAAAKVAADPVKGAKVYTATCAGCHGTAGEGMEHIAPALISSAFILAQSDSQLADFITSGRQPGDPASKTGKLMPAKGGNPFLSRADIDDVVAHLRTFKGGPVAPSASTADQSAELAAPSAPKWVVPTPPQGPIGLKPRLRIPQYPAVNSQSLLPPWLPADADSFVCFYLAITGFQTLLVALGMLVTAALTALAYRQKLDREAAPLALGAAFFQATAVMSALLVVLMFLWR